MKTARQRKNRVALMATLLPTYEKEGKSMFDESGFAAIPPESRVFGSRKAPPPKQRRGEPVTITPPGKGLVDKNY